MRAVIIKNSFNTGEISPYTLARTDLDKYKNGCEQLQNYIPLITGGITRRPGSRFIYAALGPSRLVPFVFSSSQSYVLEFGNQELRFFTVSTGGVPGIILSSSVPYVVATPYNTSVDDLWDLKFAQQGDVMYITHPNHPVMKLSRIAVANWQLTQPGFQSPPTHAFDQDISGGTITLTPGATTGTGITFTASAAVFILADIGKFIISGAGAGIITALGGSTTPDGTTAATLYPQATVDIEDNFASTGAIAAGSWLMRGAPQSYGAYGSFASGGLWLASSNLGPGGEQQLWGFQYFPAYATASNAAINIGVLQDTWREIDIGRYVVLGGSVGLITALTSAQQVSVRLFSPIEDSYSVTIAPETNPQSITVALPQAGGSWSVEDAAFGAVNGYPTACYFIQDRFILAGSAGLPLNVWASRTDNYENFAKGPAAADGLDFAINSATQQPIKALCEFRGNLGVFTARDEFMVGGGIVQLSSASPQALQPDNVTAVKQSTNGTARVQPLVVQNMLVYVWRSKLAAAEMSYNIYQANFGSRNLSILAEIITTTGMKEMAYQQYPFFIIWFTTLDNEMVGLTYEVEQQVWGWHRYFTGQDLAVADKVVSMCPISDSSDATGEQVDNLWTCTARAVNGQTIYSIEFADPTLNTDCALQNVFGSSVASVSGLGYLQGRTVQVKVDGMYLGEFVVPVSGVVNFQQVYPEGGRNVEVGLPYVSRALPVRPEVGGGGQTVQGLKKKWDRVWLRVYNTVNVLISAGAAIKAATPYGNYRLLGRQPNTPLATAVPPFTGDVRLDGPLGDDFDGQVLIQQDQPFPSTILGIFGSLTIGEQ